MEAVVRETREIEVISRKKNALRVAFGMSFNAMWYKKEGNTNGEAITSLGNLNAEIWSEHSFDRMEEELIAEIKSKIPKYKEFLNLTIRLNETALLLLKPKLTTVRQNLKLFFDNHKKFLGRYEDYQKRFKHKSINEVVSVIKKLISENKKLRNSLDEIITFHDVKLVDVNGGLVISDLNSKDYELNYTMPITIQKIDGEIVGTIEELEITEFDKKINTVIQNIQEYVVDLYESLSSSNNKNLSPELQEQKKFLLAIVRPS